MRNDVFETDDHVVDVAEQLGKNDPTASDARRERIAKFEEDALAAGTPFQVDELRKQVEADLKGL